MVLGSKLLQRFFLAMVAIIAMFALAIYFYSVPLIKSTVYGIELNASRTVLNNVYQLAEKIHFSLEGYRLQALEARKQQLRSVVSLATAYAEDIFARVERGELSDAQARSQLFEGLRNFTYGNNDYIWVASYDAVLLSHPDARFHGVDTTHLRSGSSEAVISRIIDQARAEGDGFIEYQWQRLDQREAITKISYVKNFPNRQFVLGSGLYLDDIEAEVQKRLTLAMAELRVALQEIKIAKTGYLYIFDADANMLIHPNENLDGTNFLGQLNPATGNSIAQELIAVADTGKEWAYPWDKPSDPGHYVYQKTSLVRHLKGFDWYIGSSVYEDELRRSSEVLTERIMTITVVVLLLAVLLALLFMSQIAAPIKRLAETAKRVSRGDLSAKSGINTDDELGVLGRTFDAMVTQLSRNIQTLDRQVQSRTQELAATEQRQRMILDELPAQIAYVGADQRYRFVNRRYAQMFNQTKRALVGRSLQEVMSPEMYPDIVPYFDRTLAGEECGFEYRFQHEGREVVTKRKLIPEFGGDGKVTAVIILSLDVTAEKEAEHKLTEAQRMNAVGQLAGGLAHDFNNLLTVVIGNLITAGDRYAQVEGLSNYLEPAVRAGQRGADITNRLLAFSRNQSLVPTRVDVALLLHDSLTLLQGSLPSNIDIRLNADTGSGSSAYVDQSQFENAIFNLALNARDAMPKGGALTFGVQERRIDHPVEYDEMVVPGDYLEVSVLDSGGGFDRSSLNRAFEPFFTTKSGTSSGLGLSMVYGFVKQSKGYIRIESRIESRIDNTPGAGACVILLLPASHAEPQAAESPAPEQAWPVAGEGRLILLVEDDADVRAVILEQLVGLGFAVVEAGDGDEALSLLDSLTDLYALVSDIMMPGSIDGYELADRVSLTRTDARIILITGYAFDQQTREADQPHYLTLRKPFRRDTLRHALLQTDLPGTGSEASTESESL
ncbi:MAG: two-component system cell cycle sensor histidine kinase/response regulator CckA [Motiliproteus sp.]|jgi:two-component system cell cycle sensor histidine kinase/response regulator CckA